MMSVCGLVVVTHVGAVSNDSPKPSQVTANSGKFNNFLSVRRFFDNCQVQTNGDDLRVRATPGGTIVGRLRNGTTVNVTDRWTKITVRLKGRTITGWVASRFLNEGYVETNGDNLNVRSVAPNGSVVGKLPNNTLVKSLQWWSRIGFKDGWVADEFLGSCGATD